ncbi:uncharacterized protein LOC131845961 [Achroia grisella]|uniref:uncharacterized protein LOC131845961 n=1 Tax=Achroia grisella TaxID=688607 RepID=UPI0027D2EB6D|nr:uncharacterized protein LOC131845961 [Achroia grisella]
MPLLTFQFYTLIFLMFFNANYNNFFKIIYTENYFLCSLIMNKMMSHSRARKAVIANDAASGGRHSINKASGDGTISNVIPKHCKQRSRSSNKIPKSIRYELENALVGLCDVWFEEIKPHLVRNNIKVHVHESSGDGSDGGEVSVDHQRLPPGAPDCSHLDPASTSPVCELCRLLSNASRSIESAVSQAANALPSANGCAGGYERSIESMS